MESFEGWSVSCIVHIYKGKRDINAQAIEELICLTLREVYDRILRGRVRAYTESQLGDI